MNNKISTVCITILFLFVSSCSTNGTGHQNPLVPSETGDSRQALWFNSVQTLFDTGLKTADVDTASVVWGFASTMANEIPGDLVVFDDDTQWAVAVAIQERPGDYVWPGWPDPYLPASYPVVQFLGSDGSTLSEVFPVPVFPNPNTEDPEFFEHYCFTPKVDCTYTYFEGVDEITKEPFGFPRLVVVVTYRYGSNTYSWNDILNYWDIRVTRMPFSYEYDFVNLKWRWVWAGGFALSEQLPDAHMQANNSGQTHPDIAIDQASGDICFMQPWGLYSSHVS